MNTTGNTISPKLFTAALENIFRRLTWETRGLKIDDEYLNHLRFADDILIRANAQHELQCMRHELGDKNENQGLKVNKSKTKVMMKNDIQTYVSNTQIENVESYIYLGQRHSSSDKNQDQEIQRRITAGWTTCLKRQLYNSCVPPAVIYGTEIWALATHQPCKEQAR